MVLKRSVGRSPPLTARPTVAWREAKARGPQQTMKISGVTEEKRQAAERGRRRTVPDTGAQWDIYFPTLKPKATDKICPVHSLQDL